MRDNNTENRNSVKCKMDATATTIAITDSLEFDGIKPH